MCKTLIAACLLALSITANAQSPPGREAHADLPGVRLWYTDTGGAGEAVVFLHANTGSSRVWEYQIPAFVARGYRVIAYDRRGFGRTVIDPAGVQPGTGADDLLALVNHLKIDRFHLVGKRASRPEGTPAGGADDAQQGHLFAARRH